ncbi:hypothetical protein F5B20DRAFT_566693 [Whalleya microplaca]|nr:hypothetical protein F5B20DRAFT_566693 [Whalleya microplaca]
MKASTVLSTLGLALGATAAGALNYTDSNTAISFSGYADGKGYTFGMALPQSPSKDFIGQIVGPLTNGAGWASFDTGVSMANYLLIVAWPNGDGVMMSPRTATSYATPSVYTGDVTLSPIEKGTFVNSTHFSATFLCGGCITGGDDSFSADDTEATFAYAYSTTAVTDPTDSSTALSYHAAGFSGFGMSLTAAKSANYDTWAAMAVTNSSTPVTTPGNNSTTPVTNTTVTISNTTYDYIIAGAGPAGLIAAGRLAETGASVLLIERGGSSTYSTGGNQVESWNNSVTVFDVPGMAYYVSTTAAASTYCTDTASQAGCLLGGGSMINALMYVKPQDADFNDKWPAGWKATDVATASERLFARNPGTSMPSADGKRYDQGAYDLLSSFFGANGFSEVDPLAEPNKKHDTFAHPVWNIQNHLRGGPVKTYLPLVQNMANFKLSLNTKVIRAVRNGTWISGVEVENTDASHEIINITPRTGKVILAAGALSTPRILFYSGIGRTEQLQNVPSTITLPPSNQWIDLPVGRGLKDHPIITINMASKPGALAALESTAFTAPDNASVALFGTGSGLLTQSGQRLNFWSSVVSTSDGQTRYLQGTCNAPSADKVRIKLYVTHGLTSSTDVVLDTSGKNTAFAGSPWLQTPGDVEAYEGFLGRLVEMSNKPNSSLTLLLADGTPASANITGSEVLADARAGLTTGAHFVGSTRMGIDDGRATAGNGTAVVDLDTKVYGTDNLFVVDASMHPDLPTGNTQAIVMVAAERAVERILALDGLTIEEGSNGRGSASSRPGSKTPAGGFNPGATGIDRPGHRRLLRRGPSTRGLVRRRTALRELYEA